MILPYYKYTMINNNLVEIKTQLIEIIDNKDKLLDDDIDKYERVIKKYNILNDLYANHYDKFGHILDVLLDTEKCIFFR